MNKKYNFLLLMILVFFVQAPIVHAQKNNLNSEPVVNKVSDFQDSILAISYTPQTPIKIFNNSDFATYSTDGSGNATHPYMIDDYSIINSTEVPVWIENTTANFTLSANYLNATNWSNNVIYLKNVTNGRIEQNFVYRGYVGIYLDENCANVTLHNNTIANHWSSGIRLNNSNYINITENNIFACGYKHTGSLTSPFDQGRFSIQQPPPEGGGGGMWIDPSNFNRIIKNDIHHNLGIGIFIEDSINNTIEENCIYDNGHNTYSGAGSLRFKINGDFSIQQPPPEGGGGGMWIDPSFNNTVQFNIIAYNTNYGVNISTGSEDNLILYNDFISNNPGSSQANDDGIDNIFDQNFWDDHSGGNYSIDGSASNYDYNPRMTTLTIPCRVTTITTTTTTTSNGGTPGFMVNIILTSFILLVVSIKLKDRRKRS